MRLLLAIDEENLGGAELSFLELSRALGRLAEVHLVLSETAWTSHQRAYATLPGQVTVQALERIKIGIQDQYFEIESASHIMPSAQSRTCTMKFTTDAHSRFRH